MPLVDYGSSSDEDNEDVSKVHAKPSLMTCNNNKRSLDSTMNPIVKKTKTLPPPLPQTLVELFKDKERAPDDPTKHQGRIRTRAHVDGTWAVHVYLEVKLSSELFDIVTALTKRAQETVPETTSMLHSLKSSKGEVKVAEHADDAVELHVSLSRPLYLQELHLGRFTSDVKEAFKNKRRFNMSFSGIQRFANEENTRSFLSLRVGSGHAEVENLLTEMDSIAERYSQPKFYDHPQFHASFAWALGGDTLDESLVNILDDLDSTLLQDLRRCSVMVRRVSWKTGPTLGSVEFSQ